MSQGEQCEPYNQRVVGKSVTQEQLAAITARQTARAEEITSQANFSERFGHHAMPEDICDFVPDADMFVVKDSGARESFDSGMVRDTEDGKPDFTLIRKGPMFLRWAIHMTKGAVKYGRHNWTNANSEEEYERFKRSAARHFEQWLAGERDEDHAAAVMFNLNAAEYVLERAF